MGKSDFSEILCWAVYKSLSVMFSHFQKQHQSIVQEKNYLILIVTTIQKSGRVFSMYTYVQLSQFFSIL